MSCPQFAESESPAPVVGGAHPMREPEKERT
nr:MAG TPA: hypothetical protein [Caudoviricetes sp.]